MRKAIVVLCAVFLLAGCAGMNYSQRYDPEVDFTQLKTYTTMPLPEKKKQDTILLLKNMRFAADKELQSKGYGRDDSNPDFLVALHAVTENRVDVEQYGYSYSTGFYDHPAYLDRRRRHDPYYYDYYAPERREYRSGYDVYEYRVGTLVVDIIDADKKELIWRGIAEGVLQDDITHEYVRGIITGILRGFPPPTVN
jgi:hypothetical protein